MSGMGQRSVDRRDRLAGWYKERRAGFSVRRGGTDRLSVLHKSGVGDECFGSGRAARRKPCGKMKSSSGEGGGAKSKGGL